MTDHHHTGEGPARHAGNGAARPHPNVACDGCLPNAVKWPRLVPDRDEAARFLSLLDPTTTRFTFQTFDDVKDRKDKMLASVLHGTLDEHFATLARLNQQGAGVYVTINATDFLGRKDTQHRPSTRLVQRP